MMLNEEVKKNRKEKENLDKDLQNLNRRYNDSEEEKEHKIAELTS